MGRYETVVNMANPNKSQTLTVQLVGEGKAVLDVGCATGYLADALNARGCTVSGIEVDPKAAEIARPKLDRLVVADLESTTLAEAFPDAQFDRVVFADILEHLRDPVAILRSSLEILAADGEVVVSIPNVAHGSLRLALLEGRWSYTELGLLDRTHLRFFTLDSLVSLLAAAGLVIREAWSTTADVLATEVRIDPDGLPDGLVEWVRYQPRALDYQFVLRASRGTPTGELPDVQQAVPGEQIRPDDIHARAARELAVRGHQTFALLDRVIGLGATLTRLEQASAIDQGQAAAHHAVLESLLSELRRERGELLARLSGERDGALEELRRTRERAATLQAEHARATKSARDADARARELEARLDKVTVDRDRILGSRTWQLSRRLTAPLRFLRRVRR